MNKLKHYILYLTVTLLGSTAFSLPAIAHTERDEWGHHMAGSWGWGPMVLFWITGVLLVVLLTVTLLKAFQD